MPLAVRAVVEVEALARAAACSDPVLVYQTAGFLLRHLIGAGLSAAAGDVPVTDPEIELTVFRIVAAWGALRCSGRDNREQESDRRERVHGSSLGKTLLREDVWIRRMEGMRKEESLGERQDTANRCIWPTISFTSF